jgi:hypothetical protein
MSFLTKLAAKYQVSASPKTWKDLSDKEQEVFTEAFYDLWDDANLGKHDTVSGNPHPWGLPWLHMPNEKYETPEDYFDGNKEEIEHLIMLESKN